MNLKTWTDEFAGRRILIWGYGREGKSTYEWIRHLCPDLPLDITDGGKGLDDARRSTVNTRCIREDETDFGSYDLIMKSPGIVLKPGMGTEHICSQTELFLKHLGDRTIGITGTKGKSTTTSLIAAALAKKYRVHLVGNIGIPCFNALYDFGDEDLAVFEISCHQLEYTEYSPHIAVYLNLFQEHLDHYGSFEAYGEAKNHIYRYQKPGDIVMLGDMLEQQKKECPNALIIGKDIYADGNILHAENASVEVKETKLIGAHNYTNLAVAYETAHNLYGVSDADFLEAVRDFEPLAHRLQDLGVHKGIRFVDDSISTIGQACIKALESLPLTDSVLIGGMDRGIDYTDLREYLAERKDLHVIFMYASGRRVYEEMQAEHTVHEHMYYAEDLKEAVRKAYEVTSEGHICLLSPAASSYDHFKNFEERGDIFRKLAFEL